MKIKKGDTVLIISGKNRLKKGKVLSVFPKEERILVEGVNIRKKRQRPKKTGEKGQMVEIPSSISVCNVKLICPKCAQGTKTGYRVLDGKKYRICKKCSQEI